jgi:type IX secretion system PorP/SprF family membrane protein
MFQGMSQDLHFSQFVLAPVQINPATAGFFEGDARLMAYNRTQWRSTLNAYQTVGIAADLPLLKRPRKQDIFGLGITMDYDQAGDSKLTTIQGNLMLAYAHALNYRNNNFLMVGVNVGGSQRSWSYSQLVWDDQFQNGVFNPNNPNSEYYYGTNFWFSDVGVGVQWLYQPDFLEYYQAGFSVSHINRPRISMTKDDNIRLPVKFTATASVSIEVQPTTALIPSAYFSFQKKYREFLLGLNCSHSLPIDVKGFINKMNLGLYYRWNDAIYLATGMEVRRWVFSISYDFNVSKLTKANYAQGGVEIIVSYIIKKKRFIKKRAIPCAVFY